MSARNGAAKKTTDTVDMTKSPRGRNTLPFRIVVNGSTDPRYDMSRRSSINNTDNRRDFYTDCGWPKRITARDYVDMFQRNEYANRVVSIYPDECWAVSPDIYETEKVRNTPFEKKVLALTDHDEDGSPVDPETNLMSFWHRLDVAAGIGRFGGLFLGIDDGKNFAEQADGIDDNGRMVEGDLPERELMYLRVFDETTVRIDSLETKKSSPRLGKPKTYQIRLATTTVNDESFGGDSARPDYEDEVVHWSRMIHFVDTPLTSQLYHAPRMRAVFNRLLDISKVLGGGAEMFYQGGFPGIAFTLDPRMLEAGLPEIDEDTIDEQMYLYANHLQRWLNLVGYEAKSLAPNIADPKGNLEGQLQSVATAIGVPLRILLGAEQAQLASGQDVRTWNRRLARRHTKVLSPNMVRPTIDRLIALRCIPLPRNGWKAYKVVWPDINVPNADELSTVGDRRAASIMKYMQTGAWQIMHPYTFFTKILGFTSDESKVMLEELKQMAKVDIKPVQAIAALLAPQPTALPKSQASGAASSGTKGRSPSKPPRGGRTQ